MSTQSESGRVDYSKSDHAPQWSDQGESAIGVRAKVDYTNFKQKYPQYQEKKAPQMKGIGKSDAIYEE